MFKLFFKRIRPINYNPFHLWHIYRAIGEDIPPGGYKDDEDCPMTTKHKAISYCTEPMSVEKKEKIG